MITRMLRIECLLPDVCVPLLASVEPSRKFRRPFFALDTKTPEFERRGGSPALELSVLDAALPPDLASGRLVEHGMQDVEKHRVEEIERALSTLVVERGDPDLRAISLDHTG